MNTPGSYTSEDIEVQGATLTSAITAHVDALKRGLRVACAGIVQKVDRVKRICDVQPTEQMMLEDGTFIMLPLVLDAPILCPGDGAFEVRLGVPIGTEVLLVFSDRCFDNWFFKGGVQPHPTTELRMHDMSDGYAIPGVKSLATLKTAAPLPTTGLEIGTVDGSKKIACTTSGFTVTGDLSVTGTITASGEITGNGKALSTHVHGGSTLVIAGSTGSPGDPISATISGDTQVPA